MQYIDRVFHGLPFFRVNHARFEEQAGGRANSKLFREPLPPPLLEETANLGVIKGNEDVLVGSVAISPKILGMEDCGIKMFSSHWLIYSLYSLLRTCTLWVKV